MGCDINPVDLAPAQWAESLRRLAVVRNYTVLSQGKRGAAGIAAAQAAAQLGISVRSFLRLAQAYRLMREGSLKPSRRGRHTDVDPGIDTIVRDVTSSTPSTLSQAALIQLIRDRCAEVGLKAPSASTIRRRIGRSLTNRSGRLEGEHIDFAMGSCATDLDVIGPNGPVGAVLTIVVEVTTSVIAAYLLSAGEPDSAEFASMLEMVAARPSDRQVIRVGVAAPLRTKLGLPPTVELLSIKMRPGSLILRRLGSHLGRLAFRPNRRIARPIGEAVPLSEARWVVDALMTGTSFA